MVVDVVGVLIIVLVLPVLAVVTVLVVAEIAAFVLEHRPSVSIVHIGAVVVFACEVGIGGGGVVVVVPPVIVLTVVEALAVDVQLIFVVIVADAMRRSLLRLLSTWPH